MFVELMHCRAIILRTPDPLVINDNITFKGHIFIMSEGEKTDEQMMVVR